MVQIGSDSILTFGELWARGQTLATVLSRLNLVQAPVAVVTNDARTLAVAELGIELAGGVFAALTPDLTPDELTAMLRFTEARCIIGPLAPDVVAQVPTCAAVLADGITPGRLRPDAQAPSFAVPPHWARFVGTSGTMARPKVAVHTVGSRLANDAAWEILSSDDVLISTFAPAHDYHLRVVLNAGGTYVAAHGQSHHTLAGSVRRTAATVAVAIPWIFKQWAARPALYGLLRSLRFGIRHGPLPLRDVAILYEKIGCLVLNAYGTVETAAVTCKTGSWIEGKMDSLGQILPGVELRLRADGTEVGDDEPGELWVRGPGVMEGYLKDPAQTASVMRDGWFTTGDVMTKDRDGYYRFVGRLKSMIDVAGRKVYPEEVETVLLDHPAVVEAAVFPASDPVRGERVEAAVVLSSARSVTEHDLRLHCRSRLSPHKVPRAIRFVSSLPMTRFGRITRQARRGDASR